MSKLIGKITDKLQEERLLIDPITDTPQGQLYRSNNEKIVRNAINYWLTLKANENDRKGWLNILVGTLLLIYSITVWGYVLLRAYYWFVIPVFPGIVVITYFQAIGLRVFLMATFPKTLPPKFRVGLDKVEEHSEEVTQLMKMGYPWLVLLICYVVHLIIG